MTAQVSSPIIRSKKDLRARIQSGARVLVIDPSPLGDRRYHLDEILEGEHCFITNNRRSWFAHITRRNGKLIIR